VSCTRSPRGSLRNSSNVARDGHRDASDSASRRPAKGTECGHPFCNGSHNAIDCPRVNNSVFVGTVAPSVAFRKAATNIALSSCLGVSEGDSADQLQSTRRISSRD